MKIERINDNKIKVFLTLDDLHERNIDLTALTYNSPQTQKLFVDMMNIAQYEHDFFVNDSQILIEAVPVPPEGFEIFVTKVNEDSEFESIHKFIKNKLKKDELTSSRKIKRSTNNSYIYQFNSFDDLCNGIRHLNYDYSTNSSVYKYNGSYFLVFLKWNTRDYTSKIIETNLNEFGEKVGDVIFFEGLLEEYGERMINENAIEVIKEYF